jgi:hypothetical protein
VFFAWYSGGEQCILLAGGEEMGANRLVFVICVLAVPALTALGQNVLNAANNPSFETPDVAEGPFNVSLQAPPWALTGPTVVTPTPFGDLPLVIGAGVFDNPSGGGQITNPHGEQLAYIFANSYAGSLPGDPIHHAFTQILPLTYQPDNEYELAIGFAHAQAVPPADSVLTMSLFAYDAGNPSVEQLMASETLTVNDVNGATLTDFFASTNGISASAIGKQIGIRISTQTAPKTPSATGQFDFDNVRLTVIPEPASASMLVLAAAMALGARRRQQ